MTLEDFFTLTEMKDGLTTPARVEDLVSMMQEEKDSIVKNIGEAARQWCTVASTLAATESKESLDHFIRLNGLYFLDLWLQEALKCGNDTSDSSLEELINGLLGALTKLPIDKETSVPSGIEISVKNLFGHKSVRVQQTARALYDSWNEGRKNSSNLQNIEKDVGLLYSDVRPGDTTVTTAGTGGLEHPATDITSVGGIGSEDNEVINPKIIGSECAKGVKSPIASDQNPSHTKLNQVDEGRLQGDAKDASIMSSSCQASAPTMEESSSHTVERTNIEFKASSPEDLNATTVSDKTRFSPDSLGKKENFIVSTTIGHDNSSCADHLNSQQHVPETPIVTDESMYLLKRKLPKGLDSDVSTQVYQTKSEGTDLAVLDHLSGNMEHGVSDQDNAVFSNVCQDVYVNGCILRNSEDSEIPFHKENASANIADLDEESNLIMRDSTFASYISKPNDTKPSNLVNKKNLNVELDFVVDDALEVARQVAKEVEREVVDYREPLCSSSSEKKSEDRVMQPRSPDSVNGVQDLPPVGRKDEVLTDHNIYGEPLSSDGDDSSRVSKSMDRTNDFICNQDSSHGPETAPVLDQNTRKNLCSFDLNEDVRSEEMDYSKVTMSSPITVAASKAAINQLAAPRSFGGEQGWKGSAATSAFRPASPRKIPDERAVSAERSSNSSKQRQSFLNIDLNVDGANNDGGNEPITGKQIPASSGLPSGESSIEMSSKRAERLKLDLNRVSEDEDAPLSDCRMESHALYHNQNGHHSPSPASSSSTRQPSMWNIDLNGSPCVFDSYDQRLSLGESSSKACGGGVKKDDPIISIMGARVAVNRRETAPHAGGAFVPNGQITECPTSANIARSGSGVGAHSALAYLTTPPGFLYNGLSMGPSTSISPIVYGSAMASGPYRVDSVVPVVPHIMNSPVAAPQAAYTQSPFLVSMTSVPSGFNCIGSRLPGLDLNSSWGDSRDAERGSLRQLFMQAPGVLAEEMRSGSLPSSSDMRVKRKEPDGGWDSYPVVHKQQAPWH